MGLGGFLASRDWGCHHHNAKPPPMSLGKEQHLLAAGGQG